MARARMTLEQLEEKGSLQAHEYGKGSAPVAGGVVTLPNAPTVLWKGGRKRWKEMGNALSEAGILTIRDLMLYCYHCFLYQYSYDNQSN